MQLSPAVIREAISYVPFRNLPDTLIDGTTSDSFEFDENVTFEGATEKSINDQTVVEIMTRVTDTSTTGNAGVSFRTDFWLNTDICAGKVRPADVDEREWKGTMARLRTLNNIARAIGIKTDNPVDALTAPDAPSGTFHITLRAYRANNQTIKWEIKKASKVTG